MSSRTPRSRPMMRAVGIAYEVADRTLGIVAGGSGLMLQLALRGVLVAENDQSLRLLKLHLPYHESDHVLNIAFNVLSGGHCLEDLERLRQGEIYLAALGAESVPDPTTAGGLCRRFTSDDVDGLMASSGSPPPFATSTLAVGCRRRRHQSGGRSVAAKRPERGRADIFLRSTA